MGIHGTFSPNKLEPVHRWYPYLEGFSSTFVSELIDAWKKESYSRIFDPFGGTGTTLTVGLTKGMTAGFSEINPFMQLVIDCKTNVIKEVAGKETSLDESFHDLLDRAKKARGTLLDAQAELSDAFPGRPYFAGDRLIDIVALRKVVLQTPAVEPFGKLARIALASIGVSSSEMIRQTDLRYRVEKELLAAEHSVFAAFIVKAKEITEDISKVQCDWGPCELVSQSALELETPTHMVDFIVTSPPYLNGTNYFRNTKIELWLAGYISHERELIALNQAAMIAGINNVSKNSRLPISYAKVEDVARKLEEVAYDSRIPKLVRGYCSDTGIWLSNCYERLTLGGRLIVDIGDSKFAGVHVPTDEFIALIANEIGFKLLETQYVRARRSKDGTNLKQVLLVFEKVS